MVVKKVFGWICFALFFFYSKDDLFSLNYINEKQIKFEFILFCNESTKNFVLNAFLTQ